jgi:hypothetical protein
MRGGNLVVRRGVAPRRASGGNAGSSIQVNKAVTSRPGEKAAGIGKEPEPAKQAKSS